MEWIIGLIALGLTILGAEWTIGAWLNRQFVGLRTLIYESADKLREDILGKLEYHERHDDSRFTDINKNFLEINNNLWLLRIEDIKRKEKEK